MDLIYVKKLVKLLSESAVDEIEIEEDGKKIRVAKHATPAPAMQHAPAPGVMPVGFPSEPAAPAAAPPAAGPNLHEIKSPIVGTFYRAPAPDAAPFVQVGTVIQPGTVLCIVEAMKLMNEIQAEVAGQIVKIYVENGQPVEYGQPLFGIKK